MSGFFGLVMSSLITDISTTSTTLVSSSTTAAITASATNTNGGTLTYSWQKAGTTCTTNTPAVASTTFTGSSTAGTTTVYCNINNSLTGVTASTPLCTITWTAIPITAMSFTLNGAAFTTAQSGTAGTSYTIAVSSTTPSTATNSPVILTVSTAGAYSLTSVGTGNYTGSFTSPTLTINAVVTGSITQNSPRTTRQVPCSAILTGATATGYAWAFQSGSTGVTFSTASLANTNVNGPASGSSVVRCTISYSGGTQVPTTSIQWGIA
jgi:hypothetical protein